MWKFRNSQVAMEFVLLVSLGFVILSIFLLVNLESRADLSEEREYAALHDLALLVKEAVHFAGLPSASLGLILFRKAFYMLP